MEVVSEYIELVDRYQRAVAAQARLDGDRRYPFVLRGEGGTMLESPYIRIIGRCVVLLTRL